MFDNRRRAIFFDRDGVLNLSTVIDGKPYAPRKLNEFVLYSGINLFITKAKSLGFVNLVVTNQPDIGHGLLELDTLGAMHAILKASLDIDEVYTCPHTQSEGCVCRKPGTGLIEQAATEFNLNLGESWLIGDRITDIATAEKAGINPVFIDRGYRESLDVSLDCKIVSSFDSAMHHIFESLEEK